MKVNDGGAAVSRARHEHLDATILISTGKDMDLAETALNLRDINPAVEIIILVNKESTREEAAQTDAVAHAIPKTRILTTHELNGYLVSPQRKARLAKTVKH
jgi:hypothetical protein